MHRIALVQQLTNEGVTGFVVGRVFALRLGHDHALALRAHEDFVFGFFEVLHFDGARVAARSHQSGFVAQVGQVGAAHAGRATGNDRGAHVLADRDLAHVHVEDLLTATDIGQGHVDLAVKTARAQQSGVQDVGAVGRGHDDHAEVGLKAVHLNQHLVQGLLAFVVATAQARTALATHGVDFIDEDDARRVFLGVVEHVANARCAHADEHFHEVRARDAEEGHLGFTRDGLGEQGLTGARWAHQQQTTGNSAAQFLKPLRVFEEIHDFLDFFFGFVAACHVSKGDGVGVFVKQAGFGFAKAERTALATALHLAHEVHPHANQQEHRAPAHEQGHQERAFFAGLDVELHAVGNEVADQTAVEVGGGGAHATVIGGDGHDLGTARAFLDGGRLDASGVHLIQKFRIAHGTGRSRVGTFELFENSEEDHGNDHPHGNFRKPLVVQDRLLTALISEENKIEAILGFSSPLCGVWAFAFAMAILGRFNR